MSTVAHETSTLSERIARVRRGLTEAAQRANRSLDEITLVAVSKAHPAASIEAARPPMDRPPMMSAEEAIFEIEAFRTGIGSGRCDRFSR